MLLWLIGTTALFFSKRDLNGKRTNLLFYYAVATVRNNVTDLWETVYDYAIIEEYYEGIGNMTFKRWFFEYNKETDAYDSIDEPRELKHYAGFALG